MAIKVCGWRVLVKPLALEEVDDTFKKAAAIGLAIPELNELQRQKQAISTATVIAVGGQAWENTEPWAKVGDRVAFSKYAGKWIKDPEDEKDYLILNDEDIVCVLEGGKDE